MKFIYSHGGFAREILLDVKRQFPHDKIYFVDDAPKGEAISYHTAQSLAENEKSDFVIAFGNSALREKKTKQVLADGFGLFSSSAKSVKLGQNVIVGEGAILCEFTVLTCDLTIGKSFHCNLFSLVAHDCIIGNYVTLSPQVTICGNVTVENHVYFGVGATVLQGSAEKPIHIGEGAIIGAHALVTKDVPAHTTVIGVPAKALVKNNER